MLTLITGVPGSGKTLWLVDHLSRVTDRPIYYFGIPGLCDSLGWICLSDPTLYHEEVPVGAIVVIDEVQKHFPMRSPSKPIPPAVVAIEEHRHSGWDIYFLTQRPTFLDHHARGLAGRHVHLHRNMGFEQAVVYDCNRYTDVDDRRALREGVKKIWRYPRHVYSLYKSADVHTHKRRFPKKVLLVPLLLFVIGYLFFRVYSYLTDDDRSVNDANDAIVSDSASVSSAPDTHASPVSTVKQGIDWTSLLTPDLSGIPYTAPIYRDLASKPSVLPKISACIATKDQSRCRCYTQQATRIQMDLAMCLHFVENPHFDMFRSDDHVQKVSTVKEPASQVLEPVEKKSVYQFDI